jgi:hypothetical protein
MNSRFFRLLASWEVMPLVGVVQTEIFEVGVSSPSASSFFTALSMRIFQLWNMTQLTIK